MNLHFLKPALFFALQFTLSANASPAVDNQWAVCDSNPSAVLKKFGGNSELDVHKIQIITYYDTETATYIRDGVTFRTKATNSKDESSVKIHFPSATEIKDADCQWDRYDSDMHFTCDMKNKLKEDEPLWSNRQSTFLADNYRSVNVNKLKSFGPFDNRKWNLQWNGLKVVFDTVDTKEAGHLMEFSIQTPYDLNDTTYADFTTWLKDKDITLCSRQEGKTARLFRAMGILKQ